MNAAFWNQLFQAGLIVEPVDKNEADLIVFGSTKINRNRWNFGIADLVNEWAESKSSRIRPTGEDCARLIDDVRGYRPCVVALLHSKVRDRLANHFKLATPTPYGPMEWRLDGVDSNFFVVPFPHGNAITTKYKVAIYREISAMLEDSGQERKRPTS